MNRLQSLHKAEQLANSVLENLANLNRALDEWPLSHPTNYNLLESTKWQIIYIYNDADIRAKEPAYAIRASVRNPFRKFRKFR